MHQGSGGEQEKAGDQSGGYVVHHNAPATREVLKGADGTRLANI
jgi:hypothetical protein